MLTPCKNCGRCVWRRMVVFTVSKPSVLWARVARRTCSDFHRILHYIPSSSRQPVDGTTPWNFSTKQHTDKLWLLLHLRLTIFQLVFCWTLLLLTVTEANWQRRKAAGRLQGALYQFIIRGKSGCSVRIALSMRSGAPIDFLRDRVNWHLRALRSRLFYFSTVLF